MIHRNKRIGWIIALMVCGTNFLFTSLEINAQELKDDIKCEGVVSKAAQTFKECFGSDIVIEFSPKQIHKFGIVELEEEWALLDAAVSIQNNPSGSIIHIVIYGGKINKKGELKERADRLIYYLTQTRKFDSNNFKIINGGFREKIEFELWLSPSKNIFPPLSPTVNVEDVRFKGKMKPLERELGN